MTTPDRPINLGASVVPGMFLNLLWTIGAWQGSGPWPSIVNNHGFPETNSNPYSFLNNLLLPDEAVSTTQVFVLKWVGTIGNFGFGINTGSPGMTVVDGAEFVGGGSAVFGLYADGTDGRIEFRFNQAQTAPSIQFPANGLLNNVTSICLCLLEDEPLWDAIAQPEQVFNPRWLAAEREPNAGMRRPMGFPNPNDTNLLTKPWSHRSHWKNSLHFGEHWRTDCWAGSATGTNTYVVSAPTGIPAARQDGDVVQFYIAPAQANLSGTATLNIGDGVGAKPLLPEWGYTPIATGYLTGNCTAIWCQLLDAWIVKTGGLTCRVPIEISVAYANVMGSHLWDTIPPHTLMTDAEVGERANYVDDNLHAGLEFWLEYANEIWNVGGGYWATLWVAQMAAALGFAAYPGSDRGIHDFYGLQFVLMMRLAQARSTRVKGALAFQAFGEPSNVETYRCLGTDLKTGIGFAGYDSHIGESFDTAPNRPIDFCEALSYATYFSGALFRNFDPNWSVTGISTVTAAVAAFESGGAGIVSAFDVIENDIRQGTRGGVLGGETLEGLLTIYAQWETLADDHGKEINNYEGGPEFYWPSADKCTGSGNYVGQGLGIDGSYGGDEGRIALMVRAFKASDRMRQIFVDQQDQAHDASPRLRHGSQFILMLSIINQWSAYETTWGSTRYSTVDALVEINGSARRWSVKLA
jgi:hypothetical protein